MMMMNSTVNLHNHLSSPSLLIWNANGLLKHINDINAIITDYNLNSNANQQNAQTPPLVWAFTETHLTLSSSIPNIYNYSWLHHHGVTNHSGGISLLIHHSVAARMVTS